MPYAQAGIIYTDHGSQLVSYETIVCEVIAGWLHVYGTFSASTRKHIAAYLKEGQTGLTYHDAKMCYENDVEINVDTGELRPAATGMIQTIGLRHDPRKKTA